MQTVILYIFDSDLNITVVFFFFFLFITVEDRAGANMVLLPPEYNILPLTHWYEVIRTLIINNIGILRLTKYTNTIQNYKIDDIGVGMCKYKENVYRLFVKC